jgi:hypothetical protein
VGSRITNLPGGLRAAVKTGVPEGAAALTLTISGTPGAASSAAAVIRLPASALTGGEELPVAVNPGAKFAITGTAVDIYAALNSDAAGSAAKILKNGEALHTLDPSGGGGIREYRKRHDGQDLEKQRGDLYRPGQHLHKRPGGKGAELSRVPVWKAPRDKPGVS